MEDNVIEVIKIAAEVGVLIVIAVAFIWDWVTNRKQNTTTLNEIKETNKNIAEATKNSAEATRNVAKATENTAVALEIIQRNQTICEEKLDRNYQKLVEIESEARHYER